MKATPGPKPSRLEEFASWFHQDFDLQFPDVASGGKEYLGQLSEIEREAVRRDLKQLLDAHPGKSESGLRNAWRRLGAVYWPQRGSTREILEGFLR